MRSREPLCLPFGAITLVAERVEQGHAVQVGLQLAAPEPTAAPKTAVGKIASRVRGALTALRGT